MYRRTNSEEQLGFLPSFHGSSTAYIGEPQLVRQGPPPPFDVQRAIARNKDFQKKLGWDANLSRLRSYLHLSPSTTPQDFAWAVATWQYQRGGENRPDGIIGPNTWAKLQSAMKLANPPPVSPSQVSPVPNEDKNPKLLALGIYEAEFMMLEAWQSSLNQFGEVMKAVSDKEGTANFARVLEKWTADKLIATVAKKAPGMGTVVEVLNLLEAENKRAKEAQDVAQLRDFLVRFQRKLTDARIQLSAKKDDYFHLVEKNSTSGSEADKRVYKNQLVQYLNHLDNQRQNGWMTGALLFKHWAFEWIRNSTMRPPIGAGSTPSTSNVVVWVDYGNTIRKVEIWAPGGQKIAEQLLKDADGAGLRPYEWPVRRRIIFYAQNGWIESTYRLTSDGSYDDSEGARIKIIENADMAELKFKRLTALRPTTKDVKGQTNKRPIL